MAEFKDRLEQAMQRKNIRPAELAKLTGIGEGAISQYRKGAYKATQKNLEKIARVLEVSIPWLIGCEEEQPTVGVGDGLSQEDMELLKSLSKADREIVLSVARQMKRRENGSEQ